MKPFIEKLHLDESTSFYVRTHQTPQFEVPWHQHIELELILFKEGFGTAFIGNYVGPFREGDIFFLGSNLPHTFQKAHGQLHVSAVVIQFEEYFLGHDFLQRPEAALLLELFENALMGMRIKGSSLGLLYESIASLESFTGLTRMIKLLECLQVIAARKEYETVSTQEVKAFRSRHKERIDRVYQYTIDHFDEPITLQKIAGMASMSVPAFCSYFKKCTQKTYIEFLQEVRIGNACKLLTDTQKPVSEICYSSGFNTLANFNKQFLKIKKKRPLQYRKLFQAQSISL
ncbi:MAG: helix-turn-helix domain-containing protein [Terrimonas sp.]|nr:helix-turn-helix domain-containing protein [Terrimonas sp.]